MGVKAFELAVIFITLTIPTPLHTCRITVAMSAVSSELVWSMSWREMWYPAGDSTLQRTMVTGGTHRPGGSLSAALRGEQEDPMGGEQGKMEAFSSCASIRTHA